VVGGVEKLGCRERIVWICGQADARGDGGVIRKLDRTDTGANPLGGDHRVVRRTVGEHDDELIPPKRISESVARQVTRNAAATRRRISSPCR